MYLSRILYPVRVLGPGERIGLWLSGCSHACKGCSNPELWKPEEGQYISAERLAAILREIAKKHPVDGLTITGGDPMEQAGELCSFLEEINDILCQMAGDVLVYTGYRKEELCGEQLSLLKKTGVLIDGPYIEEQNHGAVLRGSDNQKIYILKENLKEKYENYIAEMEKTGNQIQNFMLNQSVVSVGIHRRDFVFH